MPDTVKPNDQFGDKGDGQNALLARDLPPRTPVAVTAAATSKKKKISKIKLGLRAVRFVLVIGGGAAAGVSILRPVTVEAAHSYAMALQDDTTYGLWNAFKTGVQKTASPERYESSAEYNISFVSPLSFWGAAQDVTAIIDRFQEIGYAALNVVASPVVVGIGIGEAELNINYPAIRARVKQASNNKL